MVTEQRPESDEVQFSIADLLADLKRREALGLIPKRRTVKEIAEAQGKKPFPSADEIPRLSFDYDVDEFIRLCRGEE